MKKHLLFILAALLPLVASAQTKVEIDGIWYNLTSETQQAEVTFKGSSYDEYTDEYSGPINLPATVTYEGVDYSVTSIGEYAFRGCSSLTTITIPEGVTSIGGDAFYRCRSLTIINIPEGVTSIGEEAFRGCSSLTTIVLPKNLEYIYSLAFANCSKLLDVYCYAEEVPSTESDAFMTSLPMKATLHVPASALDAYKSTAPWKSFGTIVSLTDEEMGIKNSELNIQSPELIYDLRGRRVEKAEKGIYIVNGKKTVIK